MTQWIVTLNVSGDSRLAQRFSGNVDPISGRWYRVDVGNAFRISAVYLLRIGIHIS